MTYFTYKDNRKCPESHQKMKKTAAKCLRGPLHERGKLSKLTNIRSKIPFKRCVNGLACRSGVGCSRELASDGTYSRPFLPLSRVPALVSGFWKALGCGLDPRGQKEFSLFFFERISQCFALDLSECCRALLGSASSLRCSAKKAILGAGTLFFFPSKV